MLFERYLINTIYWLIDRQQLNHVLMFSSSSSNYLVIIKFRKNCIKKKSFYWKTCIYIEDNILFFLTKVLTNEFVCRFERSSSSRIDVVNSLLLIQESMIARSRNRSQNAKNIIKRQAAFEVFINREFSRFEHVKAKTIVLHNENVAMKIENVIHRADSASDRDRERKRDRERDRKRAREQKRESTIAVQEKRENVISEVDEDELKKKKRTRTRSITRTKTRTRTTKANSIEINLV
jgi:hypothetical protein